MTLPILYCNVFTYKRPEYAILTIQGLIHNVRYDGEKVYNLIDMGSEPRDMEMYAHLLKDHEHNVIHERLDLATAFNRAAEISGEVWIDALDDFVPHIPFDVTGDVKFLAERDDVGQIRMGRLAFWDYTRGIYAQLWKGPGGQHYWILDKERNEDPYPCPIGFNIRHRRFVDSYFPLPAVPFDRPGEAELVGGSAFRNNPGPKVAVPVRFGEDDRTLGREPIWHLGHVRTDEYSTATGNRWAAV